MSDQHLEGAQRGDGKASDTERSVRVKWLEGYRTEVDVRGSHRLISDELPQFGGEDAGPMPTELLLASVATCLCLAVVHVARKRRVALTDLEVHAEARKNLDAFRIDEIDLRVRAGLDSRQLASLVARAERFCFVSNTLRRGCEIHVTTSAAAGDGVR